MSTSRLLQSQMSNKNTAEYSSLLSVLKLLSLSDREDHLHWNIEPSGIFSVKYLSNLIGSHSSMPKEVISAIW